MLKGCIFWPPEAAERYRAAGYWGGRTLWQMMADTVERHPDKTALVAGSLRQTCRELDEVSAALAAALLVHGIRTLDRVVLHLPNSVEFVHWYLALIRIGAIPVMALRAHRKTEVGHFVRASGAVAYIAPDMIREFDYRMLAADLQHEFAALRTVIIVGEPGPGQIAHADLLAEGLAIADRQARLDALVIDPEDVGTILLSGGTTSLPKLIPRTHQDYVLNARLCGAVSQFDEHTVFMPILPLAHNYNLASPGILGTFHHGGTVVLAPGTETDEIFRTVEQERVTVLASVRPLVARWLDIPDLDRHDLSSLKVVQNGGTRIPPELRKRMIERMKVIPQEIYGTAEGLINMTRLDAPMDALLNSSGSPVCELDELRVIDELGNEVPDGTPGELVTRGPYTICGYYDAPEVDRKAFTADGFYRMGDVVRKDGRDLYVEGRKADVINRGGEKIDCEEVENLILQHPAVHSACLIAMPDREYGERACAFVMLKDDEALDFSGLTAFLRERHIASFKLPERLEVLDAFPTSPVGKVLKRELRNMIVARLEAEEAAG